MLSPFWLILLHHVTNINLIYTKHLWIDPLINWSEIFNSNCNISPACFFQILSSNDKGAKHLESTRLPRPLIMTSILVTVDVTISLNIITYTIYKDTVLPLAYICTLIIWTLMCKEEETHTNNLGYTMMLNGHLWIMSVGMMLWAIPGESHSPSQLKTLPLWYLTQVVCPFMSTILRRRV